MKLECARFSITIRKTSFSLALFTQTTDSIERVHLHIRKYTRELRQTLQILPKDSLSLFLVFSKFGQDFSEKFFSGNKNLPILQFEKQQQHYNNKRKIK